MGNALMLTASGNGYVSVPLPVFSGATDITISTWFKVTTTVDWQKILDVGINANRSIPATTGMIYMYLAPTTNNNSPVSFGIATNGVNGEQRLEGAALIGPADGWTHLAVVQSASSSILYVNGTAVRTKNATDLPLRLSNLGNIDYAWIGRSQFTSNTTFDGAIDEFRVYDRALSADEIKALYEYTGQ